MSTRSSESSSQTWSGEERAPANIIDLDKFIHNAVRASSTRRREPAYCPRALRPAPAHSQSPASACDTNELNGLVVDAGGVERKAGAAAGVTRRSLASASTPPHDKRFSHDSGLSDGSVRQRKQRMLRRGGSEVSRRTPARRAVRGGASASSLRAFRALCERALCDQQTLIVRVAELCERLTERPGGGAAGAGPPAPAGGRPHTGSPGGRPVSGSPMFSSRSSEDSTTTHTTVSKYAGLRDKQRTGEFNTYKLIMTKLDAMSRLLAVRSRSRPRRAASSGSVTVSDKIVATEPAPLQVARSRRGNNKAAKYPPTNTRTVTVHKAILGERERGYAHPARYDHDDTHVTHIYSKAARVHTLPAMKRRAMSVGAQLEQCGDDERDGYKRDVSLCALCRFYWRTFRQ